MKKIYSFVMLVCTVFSFTNVRAQLTGIQTVPGTFPTLFDAVTALNTNGVGVGGATINVAAGYTETLSAPLILTISTNAPSVSNPLVIQKSGAGANPVITAYTGTTTNLDGIIELNGLDYVTFDGIDLAENVANTTTTTQMEWGYALLKSSATNGSQYNTIKNCTVTLNKSNTASIGIYLGNHITTSATALTVTSVSGTSSYNKFYNNTIQNCYTGISINGFASAAPYDFYDQGNQIGRDGVSTRRNQIIDFAGGTVAANGIVCLNQNAIKIFGTYINNGNTTNTNTLNGISLTGGTNANIDIYNDTITLGTGATTQMMCGILNASGATGAGNTINIYNNVVSNCNYITATSGEFRAIATTSTASYTNIYSNTVSGNTLSGIGQFSGIYYGGGSATLCLAVNLNNNTIFNNTKTGTGGQFNCIYGSSSVNTMNTYSNLMYNNSNVLSAGATYGYYNFAFGLQENVYNNTCYDLFGGTGGTYGFFVSSGSGPTNKEVYGNTVYNVTGNVSATNSVGGIQVDYGTTSNVYKNNVYNITNTTTTGIPGAVFGINVATNGSTFGSNTSIYNNFISDIKAPNASNTNAVNGLWLQGAITGSYINAFNNTVFLNATSTGANFGTSAVNCGTNSVSIDLRNNIFINNSTPAGTGLTRGITRNSAALTNYASTSGYNCIYAGTPGASNLIYSDGTNNDQTLQAFKNRVGPREQASFSELPTFINIAAAPYDLHLNAAIATQCESGGKSITSVTIDYDGNTRGATPDVGADEIAGITSDIASPDIQYTLLTNSSVSGSRTLTAFATITDPSGINTTAGTKPRLYYKKSTNANIYVDNTNTSDSWKYVEASNTASPFNFTIDYSLLFGGSGVVAGDVIQYFVTAQDLNGTPRIGLNNGGFTTQPSSVNLGAANFPLNNTVNQYNIVANTYSGVIPVGPAEAITSLTNAGGMFSLINAGVLSGNVTLNITGDLTAETGTFALNQWAEEGLGNYSVTIAPSASVNRIISGSSAAASLIRFDGADRVTIDGRFGGSGTYLTFRNTSNSAPTIGYINDAQNNTLTYSIIESGNTATSTTLGGAILIGTTNGTNGNDNNTISYCEIRDRSDVAGNPSIGINCAGTTTALSQFNNNCVISNNNIHDWYLLNGASQFAINMQTGNSGFTITGNSFYQTATRTHTVSGAITRAININFGTTVASNGGHTISDNFIGGTAPGASGGDMVLTVSGAGVSQVFTGISVITGLIPNSIQNNTITKIDYTTNSPTAAASMFLGISVTQGIHNIGTITGNTIGGASGNDLIKININAGGSFNSFLAGIFSSSTNGYSNIQNNTIGGITVGGTTTTGGIIPQWIQIQGTPSQNTIISNNLIGSTTTANSIRVTATTPVAISFGIRHLITSGAGATIANNTIQNLTNMSSNTGSVDYGMLMISQVGSQANLNVTNNTIKDFSSACAPTTPALGLLGISVQGYGGLSHDISGNSISALVNTNTGAAASYVVGIQTQGNSMGGTMNKNKIWDLRNANTGTTPGIAGVYFLAGLNWSVNNNRISLSNAGNTNNVDLTGISDVVAQNSNMSYNYNSIYIGGSAASGATNTAAYSRLSNANVTFKNNLLFNERTGGSGIHVALSNGTASPSLGWNSNASNNNAYVTSDSTKLNIWGVGTPSNLTSWRTNSGTDANSIANNNAGVTSSALFVNTATGDLHINTSTFPEALGTPIASLTTDYDGDPRSATTPTIGSDELACSVVAASLSSQTNVDCNGASSGSVTVSATGGNGITYSWLPSGGTAATASGLAAGAYTCNVTNICGSTDNVVVTVTEPAVITGTDVISSCNDLTWIDGNTYSTSNNTATMVLTSVAGCDSTVTLNFTKLVATSGTDVITSCNDLTWIDGNTYTVSNNTATHILTNAAGCDSLVTLNFTKLVATSGTDVITSCNDLTWIDGNTYTASNNTATHILTNVAGCDSVVTLNYTKLAATTGTDNITSCTPITWIDGNTYSSSNNTATHILTNAAGCDSVVTLNLTINTVNVSSTLIFNPSCFGGSDGQWGVTATGGTQFVNPPYYNYLFSNGVTSDAAVNLPAGTHTVIVTDSLGCMDSMTLTLGQPDPLIISLDSLTNISTCYGDNSGAAYLSITGGNGGYSYLWQPTMSTDSFGVALYGGNYEVIATDAFGCKDTLQFAITEPSAIDISTTTTAETISANQIGANYQWVDCDNGNAAIVGETNQSFTATANGNYAVVVSSGGCSDTSACVSITSVGIKDLTSTFGAIVVMPNPNDGSFTIRAVSKGTYNLVNELGQLIQKFELNNSNNYSVSFNDLANGVYFVIGTENGHRTKIVVTK